MALIYKREIAAETLIGLWHIRESAEWFRSQLMLDEKENALIDSIKHPQRKLHWLSSRVLLRSMMQTDQFIHLENDLNGKPIVRNFPVEISLSHSSDLSALLLSKKYKVGIDIEKMDPKVLRIQHKFVNEAEMKWVADENRIEQLYAIWCAKEAMYKLYGEKKLDFRQHLLVAPFEFSFSGKIQGQISKADYQLELNIQYEQFENYMTAYVLQ
ncbi:MAG: 4'-phosphopantetheinyl transferase superfamily protein [Chitinophagaceae bacterium]|nr:4'-phosphopantetheinyl transferase superfamily protein [Chitinophagaceae bacterium]